MKLRTAHKKAKRKERLTRALGRHFQGKNGREIQHEIQDAFSWRASGRSYRSRRPVVDDGLPTPF